MRKREREAQYIEAYVASRLSRGAPQTQDDCCRLAADALVRVGPLPENDFQLIEAASHMARGLFGEAFENADDGQRWAWIDMAERALRDVLAGEGNNSTK